MTTVTFLEYLDGDEGPTRITLTPGRPPETWSRSEKTDEGWSASYIQWALSEDGTTVERHWCNEGRDCDGFLSREGRDECRVEDLASQPAYYDASVLLPKWTEAKPTSVHDESAQNAGY